MRYQDPSDAEDPAQDPRWRSLSEQADVRYRGSSAPPRQDQGRYPGQGGSGGQYQAPGRPNGQSGSGQYPGPGRPNGPGGSGGQHQGPGRPNGQGGSGGQYPGQGRPNGPGSSGDDLWTPRTPRPERYQDSRQAVYEAPPAPAERHWDGAAQDTDWYPQPHYPVQPQRAPERQPAEHRRQPKRGSRGLIAGAFTGVLAAAIALGVAMLVSAFVRPQASPVIAVGGQAINLTPTPVKEFAVAHFGTNDKTMLLGGMYITIALIAMVIGCLARRKLILGVVGIGGFGVLGAVVALIQPASHTTDVIPSLVGGVAGVAAIIALVTRTEPAVAAPGIDWMDGGPGGGPGEPVAPPDLVAPEELTAASSSSPEPRPPRWRPGRRSPARS